MLATSTPRRRRLSYQQHVNPNRGAVNHNRAPPPPTHCGHCGLPLEGTEWQYDRRYPLLVEQVREDGRRMFLETVTGFHENGCLFKHRSRFLRHTDTRFI